MAEPGEIIRRPTPRAAPLFSSYYANKPAPIFRGLRYHIHKTTPSHIFGWLRSLLIASSSYIVWSDMKWNGASLGCFRPDIADVVILYSVTPEYHKTVDQFDTGRTTLECRAGNVWETADIYMLIWLDGRIWLKTRKRGRGHVWSKLNGWNSV